MVPTEFRLIQEMSRLIIVEVRGEESTFTEHFLSHINRQQSKSSIEYVMGVRINRMVMIL